MEIQNKDKMFLNKLIIKNYEDQNNNNSSNSQKISLYNHDNMFFTGSIQIGEQKENFKVIFDTGSTVIFINSEYCGDPGCQLGNRFDADNSNTFNDTLRSYDTLFGSGLLQGTVGQDTFYIGDLEIKNTQFVLVSDQDGAAFESDFQGIIGLSFPSDGELTIFDYMIKQNLIQKQMFAFHLNRKQHEQDSSLTFGGYDDNLIDGEVNWHQVSDGFFWSINAQQILVGEEDTEICSISQPCKLVIDSGTSLVTGPSNDLDILNEYLQYYLPIDENSDNDTSLCGSLLTLPDITFVIDGLKYIMNSNEYIISLDQDGELGLYTHAQPEQLLDCAQAFMPLDYPPPIGPLWIMGDIFMSKYLSIFDREAKKVGFGHIKSELLS